MKFACERCGRAYVASEELRGRAFRLSCRGCGEVVVVRLEPELAPDPFDDAAPGVLAPALAEGVLAPAPADPSTAAAQAAPRPRFDPFTAADAPAGPLGPPLEQAEVRGAVDGVRGAVEQAADAPAAAGRVPVTPDPLAIAGVPAREIGMLPPEDEAKLGPADEYDRRSSWPLRAGVAVAAAVALAAAAFLLLRHGASSARTEVTAARPAVAEASAPAAAHPQAAAQVAPAASTAPPVSAPAAPTHTTGAAPTAGASAAPAPAPTAAASAAPAPAAPTSAAVAPAPIPAPAAQPHPGPSPGVASGEAPARRAAGTATHRVRRGKHGELLLPRKPDARFPPVHAPPAPRAEPLRAGTSLGVAEG